MYEWEIIKDLNDSQIIDLNYQKKSIPYQIVGTQENKNCNFDAKILVNGNTIGILEIKTYHMRYDSPFFKLFSLQLCKIHFAKLDVPYMLILKCKCGTMLMYQYKKSHYKKFMIALSHYKHYCNGETTDSDEMFFWIPKDEFSVISQIKRPKFKLKSLEHLPIIEKGVYDYIPRIRDSNTV
jgi:hypothetical protein